MMQARHESIRIACQYRRALDHLARLLAHPVFPEPGQREWLAAGKRNQVRGLAGAFLFPLIKAVGQYQAASPAIRSAVSRLFGNGLGTRVDHPVADGRILCPERHESPAKFREFAGAVLSVADRCKLLSGRNVVARFEGQRRACAE